MLCCLDSGNEPEYMAAYISEFLRILISEFIGPTSSTCPFRDKLLDFVNGEESS